jgi:hypothetical protein
VRRVVLRHPLALLRRHPGCPDLVEPVRNQRRRLGHPQELERRGERGVRVAVEILAPDNVQLFGGEEVEPRGQVLQIPTAGQVAAEVVLLAVVAGLAHDALVLAGQALLLGVEGLTERKVLGAVVDALVVVGPDAVHRIAEQHDQLDVGQRVADPVGDQWVEDVVRRGLSGHDR